MNNDHLINNNSVLFSLGYSVCGPQTDLLHIVLRTELWILLGIFHARVHACVSQSKLFYCCYR